MQLPATLLQQRGSTGSQGTLTSLCGAPCLLHGDANRHGALGGPGTQASGTCDHFGATRWVGVPIAFSPWGHLSWQLTSPPGVLFRMRTVSRQRRGRELLLPSAKCGTWCEAEAAGQKFGPAWCTALPPKKLEGLQRLGHVPSPPRVSTDKTCSSPRDQAPCPPIPEQCCGFLQPTRLPRQAKHIPRWALGHLSVLKSLCL